AGRRAGQAARPAVRQVGLESRVHQGLRSGRAGERRPVHARCDLGGDGGRAWELFAMINPINHAKSDAAVATYKVEPYVMAADVYAAPPHAGRGGWTWYTGSAGWMYRLAIESLLGL